MVVLCKKGLSQLNVQNNTNGSAAGTLGTNSNVPKQLFRFSLKSACLEPSNLSFGKEWNTVSMLMIC